MSEHQTHTMHENSLEAFRSLNVDERSKKIIAALGVLFIATDRQIAEWLEYRDMNKVRPRITELIEKGILREVGKQADHVTKKKVRLVEVAV